MKQYHITTNNIDYPQDNDCIIDENDPLNDIKQSLLLDGLGQKAEILAARDAELFRKYFSNLKGDDHD